MTTGTSSFGEPAAPMNPSPDKSDTLDAALPIANVFWRIVATSIAAGAIAVTITYAIKPTYTARVVILPPEQSSSVAGAALASLGSLASLVGGSSKNPVDQYVSFLQTEQIADRVIDRFNLRQVYGKDLYVDARRILYANLRVTAGKKDGLITLEVDDKDPKRAAAMASQFIVELHEVMNTLAVTDAQQRRVFFEREMRQAKDQLTDAETALQMSGISRGSLNTQPAVAGTAYARTASELAAAQVRLQALQQRFAPGSSEIRTQEAAIAAIREQQSRLESTRTESKDEYVNRYREFKYRETMFEVFARQYEIARVDEAREGAPAQIVDPAKVPEKKTRPKRAVVGMLTTLLTFIALCTLVSARHAVTRSRQNPAFAAKWSRFKSALRRW